jgi:hypothetical protein
MLQSRAHLGKAFADIALENVRQAPAKVFEPALDLSEYGPRLIVGLDDN